MTFTETCSPGSSDNVAQEAKRVTEVDSLLERVFLLTLDKGKRGTGGAFLLLLPDKRVMFM